jgi:hypothetical protein
MYEWADQLIRQRQVRAGSTVLNERDRLVERNGGCQHLRLLLTIPNTQRAIHNACTTIGRSAVPDTTHFYSRTLRLSLMIRCQSLKRFGAVAGFHDT